MIVVARSLLRVGVFLVLLVSTCVTSLHAETFYVRKTGANGPGISGTSPASAFATIGFAASLARGGDTVVVGPGVYREGDIKPDGNGRREEPVVLYADRSGSLTGDAPGEVVIDAAGFENGFKLSARPWVVVNGFTVTNADEEGIAVRNVSDSCVITNCVVFSNRRDGIRVRDSIDVIVFNNLVYDNARHGIEFEGLGTTIRPLVGSSGGVIINNTLYANAGDGIRIEEAPPSPNMLILNNVITENTGVGMNLKEGSTEGFVGQWNLNTDGYNTSEVSHARLDTGVAPLFIAPAGADGHLGGTGHADDDFRLRQLATGQAVESAAVDASPIKPKKLGMARAASTRIDGAADKGGVDIGFHFGNTTDFVISLRKKKDDLLAMVKKSVSKSVIQFRKQAVACEALATKAHEERRIGRGACVKTSSRKKLVKKCGVVVEDVCR
jgi:parallel beta-helix repeat protein